MAGKQQGNLQPAAHQSAHVARIGIVGMNPVGPLTTTADVVNEFISQFIQVGPEQFFAEVTSGAEGETHNLTARANGLLPTAVITGHPTVLNESGDHFHPLHVLLRRQGLGQLQHVEGLPSGIRVTAQLKIPCAKQAVKVEVQEIQGSPPP